MAATGEERTADEQDGVHQGKMHLRRTAYFFMHISNLIKVKDDAWVLITQSLSYLAREAFKRFFNPKYRIEERAIKLLNLMENDRKM